MLNRKINPAYSLISKIDLPNVQIEQLRNNIKLHIINGGSQDIVKIDVLIKTGATNGIKKMTPAFVSAMLSEGTKTKNAQQIAETFDFYGAFFQAIALKDNAQANLLTLNKYLEQTLPNFAEVLIQSVFPKKEFDTQKSRMLNKFMVQNEKTTFVARNLFFEQIFGKQHPYGQKTEANSYNEVTLKDSFDFYEKYYNATNFELIVSGKITDKTIAEIDKNIGNIEIKQSSINTKVLETKSQAGLTVIEKPEAVQTSVCMGLKSINKLHPDYIGLSILTTIFGGYFGSRLMRNIREKKGYTYGIYATLISLQQAGYIVITADVKKEYAKNTIDEIENEIKKLQTDIIETEELNLVKNYFMGEMLQSLDGSMALSEAYKSVLPFDMDFDFYKQVIQKILNINAKELQQLANKYFDINKMTKIVVGSW